MIEDMTIRSLSRSTQQSYIYAVAKFSRDFKCRSTSNHSALERRAGDHAMTSVTTKPDSSQPSAETSPTLFDDWFDLIEARLRDQVRGLIEEMIRGELDAVPRACATVGGQRLLPVARTFAALWASAM